MVVNTEGQAKEEANGKSVETEEVSSEREEQKVRIIARLYNIIYCSYSY